MEKKSLLFVAGLGSTGSSALCDVLSEYSGVLCPSQEWRIWVDPDGLIDLGNKLSGETSMFHITSSINRFTELTKRLTKPSFGPYSKLKLKGYLKEAYIQIESDLKKEFGYEGYKGLWYGNSQSFLASANFVMNRKFWKKNLINKQMWLTDFSTKEEAFSIIGTVVEKQLFKHLEKTGNKHFAINENFSILFSNSILEMHRDAKIVVVIRDLLDVYADSFRVGWLAMPYEIDKFIKWQKRMYLQLIELKSNNPDRIHIVSFEALCNNYDDELVRLKEFIPELLEQRVTLKFKPEVSQKNIGQWRNSHCWLEKYNDECQSIIKMLDLS
ncbi:sulfotransferase [Agarivorans sp. QJM3NY_29]|uniref:sulfotransferase n=1 Tax=unclassified Agarivorans TaxID=2636026 RepID=UPI003D7D8F43